MVCSPPQTLFLLRSSVFISPTVPISAYSPDVLLLVLLGDQLVLPVVLQLVSGNLPEDLHVLCKIELHTALLQVVLSENTDAHIMKLKTLAPRPLCAACKTDLNPAAFLEQTATQTPLCGSSYIKYKNIRNIKFFLCIY